MAPSFASFIGIALKIWILLHLHLQLISVLLVLLLLLLLQEREQSKGIHPCLSVSRKEQREASFFFPRSFPQCDRSALLLQLIEEE
jgi:hypothetical protein